jgi:hypothetical protein
MRGCESWGNCERRSGGNCESGCWDKTAVRRCRRTAGHLGRLDAVVHEGRRDKQTLGRGEREEERGGEEGERGRGVGRTGKQGMEELYMGMKITKQNRNPKAHMGHRNAGVLTERES